ncbi:hypothetical protein [Myroides odoratus]|uniref:Uncharacterized protein n=1 Tax=Myroides odoratus TaxID=256 RepID=A0A9Q7EAA2_MYROD|nr:hypothetical protein [Myroides odoratus]EHQ41550.1 hypothetical protein Myrod_0714 [Myroides odoratus DSM 2801]EKB02753.1 hypothetical protein HMPREF9716_03686 [Myroides odoratus CIP 103059]QQT98969.1 hypothetical protein I6I88_12180 [Myroides odoratus]WQD58843.1 hypothetical protein U0010_06795 [Myroides odoratus]STZ28813.1 Uncharacterised protein [Myroides odoratus]
MSLQQILTRIALLSEPCVKWSDRLEYYLSIITRLAPVAFILSQINWWFTENQQFGQFMIIALAVNMGVGVVFHLRNKSFSWWDFLVRNAFMILAVSVVYIMLEMLRYTAGDNLVGEAFKVLIQITTLLYPTSKVLKNIHILSRGKYPPEFIMKKLYDFEKNGDLKAFFDSKNKEE